jgi:methylthioribose-1-phosphate isomerase
VNGVVELVIRNPQSAIRNAVEWLPEGTLRLLDQSLLPAEVRFIECRSVDVLAEAIRGLKVRGAPVIGIAAGYGLCLAANASHADDNPGLLDDLVAAARTLGETRPTAVNLAWALGEVLEAARRAAVDGDLDTVKQAVCDAARRLDEENTEANRRMGEYGADLLRDGMNVVTHCNAGPLAAGGIGSALGVVYTAHNQGKRLHVWVDETRPVLQGARLTTWELAQWGVPHTLITDNMAASLMQAGQVDAVILGADRIAANGDTANKIGTYGLAVLAHHHRIPFYVAAPLSTIDASIPDGKGIIIEERHAQEVTHHGGKAYAPEGTQVFNPAFDVTPNSLISAIITESGIARPPFDDAIRGWTTSDE